MTTLQTLSTRSTDSASVGLQRAQRSGFGAGDAPGFAGVLDAFSRVDGGRTDEPEIAEEDLETSGADESEESDESSAVDGQGAGNAVGDEGVDGEGVVVDRSQRIGTAAGLAQLLNNAAAVDLAGLASQQLAGQTQGKPAASDVVEQPKPEVKANTANPQPAETNVPSGFERFIGRGQTGTLQNALQGTESMGKGEGKGEGGAPTVQNTPQDQAALRQANAQSTVDAQQTAQQTAQQIAQQVAQQNSQQVAQPAKVQMAQVVQAQVADFNPNSRRLDGVRGINEIAGAGNKGQAVTGSESAGKAGADQGGLDLGNRPQNAGRLMESTPTDDRAMQRQQIMAQVQRGLASIMNTKGGTMKLRLSPENLGEVNIKMTTKDGHVRVSIEAKNDETRSMLKEGLDGLRQSMESRGVRVDDLRVDGRVDGRVDAGFERFLGDSGQDGSRSSRDQHEGRGGDGNGGDEDIGIEDGVGTKDTPGGIWTDFGLDAIA